jgi:hypothetical protein
MNDPIVDEVRRIRDEHAARFNYDLQAIFAHIKQREQELGLKFVDGVALLPESVLNGSASGSVPPASPIPTT